MKRKPKIADNERFRRCRLGELRRLFRDRWGAVLPDDDAGREDLRELLLLASMAFNPDRNMRNVLSQAAPWMDAKEAAELIDDVNRTPTYLRKPSARILGDRLRLTSEERHRLGIRTIRPFDRTDAELKAERKAKDSERKWRKRRARLLVYWSSKRKRRITHRNHPPGVSFPIRPGVSFPIASQLASRFVSPLTYQELSCLDLMPPTQGDWRDRAIAVLGLEAEWLDGRG